MSYGKRSDARFLVQTCEIQHSNTHLAGKLTTTRNELLRKRKMAYSGVLHLYTQGTVWVKDGREVTSPIHTTTSKLNRSDKGCALLRPWPYGTLERRRVAKPEVGRQRIENSTRKRSPDYSVSVTTPRLDHAPGSIDIFFDIKHCQRHSASEP